MVIQGYLLQSWLSCRALFNWMNPVSYFASLIALPVSIGLIFAFYEQPGAATARAVVGPALLAAANAVLYGVTQSLVNEKPMGTLMLCLCAPQSLFLALVLKCLVHVVSGLFSGTVSLLLLYVLLRPGPVAGNLAAVLCYIVVVSVSATGLSVFLGAIGIRLRDPMTVANVTRSVLLLGSGALLNPRSLPVDLTVVRDFLPSGHLTADSVISLENGMVAWHNVLADLAVGMCWLLAGFLVLRWSLAALRYRANLDFS